MSSMLDYMQLCRLCLVKEKVNVPIFSEQSDVRQIYLKISACLPVKISRDDSLPKKICDNCFYKVDLLYQFWNTTVNAEKQLTEWLGNLGVDIKKASSSTSIQHSTPIESLVLKQENHDPPSEVQNVEQIQEFLPSTQIYRNYNQQFASSNVPNDNLNSSLNNEPSTAKRRGRPPGSTKKKSPPATQTSTNTEDESMEEDSTLNEPDLQDSDESMEDGKRIAKEEQESDIEYEEQEVLEPTTFVGVTSETPCDTEQPGPSGLNKPATITASEAGSRRRKKYRSSKNTNENDQDIANFCNITIKEEPLNSSDLLTIINNATRKRKNRTSQSVLNKEINKCVICNKTVTGRSNIIKHYLIHKDKKIKQNKADISKREETFFLRCQICTQEFSDKIEFEDHEKNYHIKKKYMCAICNKCYSGPQHFITHMRAHKTQNTPLKCTECDFTTIYKLAYIMHSKSHPRLENPFTCQECGEQFTINKDLNAHKREKHAKKTKQLNFECQICQKIYTRKSRLKSHMKNHTGDPSNKCLCDICGKHLGGPDYLRIHKRIHAGDKPYACTYCDKKFTTRIIWRDHLRVHSGEKPFACEHCGKCFSQRTPLTIHLRLHTGERPYVCHICSKGFVSKGSLGIHLKQGRH